MLLVRDCLFVVPKYAYFAAGLYILEVVSLSATWDAGGSRQLCSGSLQPVPPSRCLFAVNIYHAVCQSVYLLQSAHLHALSCACHWSVEGLMMHNSLLCQTFSGDVSNTQKKVSTGKLKINLGVYLFMYQTEIPPGLSCYIEINV